MYLGFHHVDGRGDLLAHRRDVEVELVSGPSRLHLRPAGDMLLKLVDVVGDAPPRLVLAEVVGQVDVDGLSHNCDVARRSALFKLACRSMIPPCEPLLRPFSSSPLPSRHKARRPRPHRSRRCGMRFPPTSRSARMSQDTGHGTLQRRRARPRSNPSTIIWPAPRLRGSFPPGSCFAPPRPG